MFIHIGGDVLVLLKDIVLVIDVKAVQTGPATREFIEYLAAQGKMEDVSRGQPKSYVICTDRVFASPISAQTLRKRVNVLPDL